MARPFYLEHTFADDAFHRVSDLAGQPGNDVRMLEGFIEAQTNGVKFRYGPDSQPSATDGGGLISANSGRGVGPVRDVNAAWDMRRLWVRNATAGSNALLVMNGVVE